MEIKVADRETAALSMRCALLQKNNTCGWHGIRAGELHRQTKGKGTGARKRNLG